MKHMEVFQISRTFFNGINIFKKLDKHFLTLNEDYFLMHDEHFYKIKKK